MGPGAPYSVDMIETRGHSVLTQGYNREEATGDTALGVEQPGRDTTLRTQGGKVTGPRLS